MIASIPESTKQAPLFHKKYPNPDAITPNQIKTLHCINDGDSFSGFANRTNEITLTINAPK